MATNGNGIFGVSYGAMTLVGAVILQFVGVVIWAQNEHAQRLELQHRFDEHLTRYSEAIDGLERQIQRMDANGTRRLQLVEDRQNQIIKVIDELRQSLIKRGYGGGADPR